MEKSGFQKKLRKKFRLRKCSVRQPTHSRYVPPVSRAPASELVLQRGGLPSEIALPRGSLESKIVYRGVVADFEKAKKYFRLIGANNEQGSMKRGEK